MSHRSSFHYNHFLPSFLNRWERTPVTEGTKMSSIPRFVLGVSNCCFLFLDPVPCSHCSGNVVTKLFSTSRTSQLHFQALSFTLKLIIEIFGIDTAEDMVMVV